jgi:hypothetical protein
MSFTTSPVQPEYRDIGNGDKPLFQLVQDVQFDGDFLGYIRRVTIPAGFRTDFGSVPAVFDWIVPPVCAADPAYLLHDAMYSTLWPTFLGAWNLTFQEANEILRSNMEWSGIAEWKSDAAYIAVQLAGGSHWRTME